jgi:creatinine amidohydrolase/Fe(II)-dependent formamide hydrolase-like protein
VPLARKFAGMAINQSPLSAEQIEHMTQRFLSWRLPENFNPDDGVSFTPVANEGTSYEHRHQPTGTNLFSYEQARQMVLHMATDLPAAERLVR